jgi:hypothetical protein
MAGSDRRLAQDGYGPITEGYQPGKAQPLQKGHTTASTSGNAQQQSAPRPPNGGSSASKPPRK